MTKKQAFLENVVGAIVLIVTSIAPWLLGSTTAIGYWFITVLGFFVGAVVCVNKRLFVTGAFPPGVVSFAARRGAAIVWLAAILLIVYIVVSILNPAAELTYSFFPGIGEAVGVDIKYFDPIIWLPHTYDKARTLKALIKYVSLLFWFIAARAWFSGNSYNTENVDKDCRVFPTYRFTVFLWTISINSAVLAFVGILQRLDGTDKLLWLFHNHLNGGQGAFGPFPYQSNGAQLLNLVWPIMVGFWFTKQSRSNNIAEMLRNIGRDTSVVLVMLIALVIGGVVVAKSRGAVIVLVYLIILVCIVVSKYCFFNNAVKVVGVCILLLGLIVGAWTGGQDLINRFSNEELFRMSGRTLIYDDASRMVDDFIIFGSGAETFAPLMFFYRNKDPNWNAYAHNDYLETIITFGVVGFVLVVFVFLGFMLFPALGNGVSAPPEFILLMFAAISGILLHARFDLPFQIYSLHFEFVVICAFFSCLKWRSF